MATNADSAMNYRRWICLALLEPGDPVSYLERDLGEAVRNDLTKQQLYYMKRHYVDQRFIVDIAAELGLSASTVCKTIKRGRAHLDRIMQCSGPDVLELVEQGNAVRIYRGKKKKQQQEA